MNIKDTFQYLQKKVPKAAWSIIPRPSVGWFSSFVNEDHPKYSPASRDIKEPKTSIIYDKQPRKNNFPTMLNVTWNNAIRF